MNNEIKAWIETTDDVVALKILQKAIDERLEDLHAVNGGSGSGAASHPAAMTAGATTVPVRRSEPGHTGSRAEVMTGPNPAPFYADHVRSQVNAQVMADARANALQGGALQRARAEQLNQQEAEVQGETVDTGAETTEGDETATAGAAAAPEEGRRKRRG